MRSDPGTSRPRLPWAFALLVAAACGGEPAAPEMEAPPVPVGTILGRAFAPGAPAFTGVTARVRWGSIDASRPMSPDGTFAVPLFDSVAGFGSLTLETTPASRLNPAWVLLTPGDLDGMGTVVMVPSHWTIAEGDHGGVEVPIRPDLATDTRVMPSYWGSFFPFRQEGFLQTVVDNTTWSGQFATWTERDFPIPIALDRTGSNGPFAAGDSALFWSHVDRMEAALGRDVFRPAPIEEMRILGGTRRADRGILVQVDTTLSEAAEADPSFDGVWTWSLTANASQWSTGNATRIGFFSTDILGARVSFHGGADLADRRLVVHELMHALGVGHGCSWPSVQTYCGSLQTELPTAEDVAHLQVLEAVRGIETELDTRWGLMAAVLGAHAAAAGDPIPGLDLVFGPANVAGSGR